MNRAYGAGLWLLMGLMAGCGGGGGDGVTPPPTVNPPASGGDNTQPPPTTPPTTPPGDNGNTPPPVTPPVDQIPQGAYDIGQPVVQEIHVSPSGDDANSGASANAALRTLTAAWNRIPQGSLTTTGYRILLAPGTYAESDLPNYMESRHGTHRYPVILEAAGGPGSVVLQGDLNLFDVRYLYLMGLNIVPQPAGDALHCEQCEHLLIRDTLLNGGAQVAQEALKVNQSQHVYIENSDISGAWDNAIDFVGVQYGHVINSRIHNAGDWCHYLKGGSAYFRVEGNEYFNCGVGGFTAGQGTGFQFMTPPWLHYEAYDIRFINNIVHDVEGAAIGVNGGFNVLFAHNTFYRVGTRSHLFEVVAGLRSCDGQPGDAGRERCQQYLDLGGWGTTVVDDGTNQVLIPNQNVLVLNNIFYNPAGTRSAWQHLQIFGALATQAGSNVPANPRGDAGLVMRGNLIWNGDNTMPLGIEDGDACAPAHPSCTAAQLVADNRINTTEPQLIGPESGNYRPVPGGSVESLPVEAIPEFSWAMAPMLPAIPVGSTETAVTHNRDGQSRAGANRIGAY